MQLDKMIEDWEEQKFTDDYFQLSDEFDLVDKLCGACKKLLYIEKSKGNDLIVDWDFLEFLKTISPIEQIFYLCWVIYKTQSNVLDFIKIKILPQCDIKIKDKNYKTDFCFEYYCVNGKEQKFENPIIVECDGYDSHSSKQQRNYDTNRENDLKMAGYSVIRFTGTQIYTEPYKCVVQTAKFIYDRNKAQMEEARKEYKNGK